MRPAAWCTPDRFSYDELLQVRVEGAVLPHTLDLYIYNIVVTHPTIQAVLLGMGVKIERERFA